MSDDPYKYFRIEARELVEGMTQTVLELRTEASHQDLVGRLLRLAHTLKGAARVVGRTQMAERAHAVEEVLAPYREGGASVPHLRIDELLTLLDAIAGEMEELKVQGEGTSPRAGHATAGPPEATELKPETATNETPRARVADGALESMRVELSEVDTILAGIAEITVQLAGLQSPLAALGRAEQLTTALLDQLDRRWSGDSDGADLGSTRAKARSLAEEIRGALGGAGRSFAAGIERVDREVGQLYDKSNRLRLVPAGSIFGSLDRIARESARALGKRVAFSASGGEIRLDTHVLAALGPALIQLVRNAVAHGVELESKRLHARKPPTGGIHLDVTQRGGRVTFSLCDDGDGIDVDAIRQVAVHRGLIPSGHEESLSLEQTVHLILKGGVTTTARVDEVSGRGVGLDVVRDTLASLRGTVAAHSERGIGTTIALSVPVTLTSFIALIVEVDGVSASIPLDAVREVVRVTTEDLVHSPQCDGISYQGEVIPFLSLTSVLRLAGKVGRHQSWSAVVLRRDESFVAVGVDRLHGTANVVVRSLPALAAVDPIVAGLSLDAEGTPQLVLDPVALADMARSIRRASVQDEVRARPAILVVDDSLTTRMLAKSILESAGYEVDVATSGEDALGKVQERRYRLMVSDIEMPGMNGFELAERTRSDPSLSDMPVLLMTSRDSSEDRQRGEHVGARAYFVKSEFNQEHLLSTIQQLIG